MYFIDPKLGHYTFCYYFLVLSKMFFELQWELLQDRRLTGRLVSTVVVYFQKPPDSFLTWFETRLCASRLICKLGVRHTFCIKVTDSHSSLPYPVASGGTGTELTTVPNQCVVSSAGCKYTCHTACRDRVSLDCHPIASPVSQDQLNNNTQYHVSTPDAGFLVFGFFCLFVSFSCCSTSCRPTCDSEAQN